MASCSRRTAGAGKELTRRGDELAAERRELPWVPIEKEYSFAAEGGPRTLRELFDGRSQLIVYHFMFGPTYTAGCPICSSAADTFNGAVAHLNSGGRDNSNRQPASRPAVECSFLPDSDWACTGPVRALS